MCLPERLAGVRTVKRYLITEFMRREAARPPKAYAASFFRKESAPRESARK